MARNTELGSGNFAVITKDDSNDLAAVTEYLHVQSDGNLIVHNKSGTAITLAVKGGTMYPIGARRVVSTNTTCGQVVGFWAE
jgi:hypothetical protein